MCAAQSSPIPHSSAIKIGAWARRQSGWLIGLAYLTAYVALEWTSYVQPFGQFGITPWNPHTGLSFVLILLCGPRFIPLLFAAPFLADLVVRGLPAPLSTGLLLWLVVGASYTMATLVLSSSKYDFQMRLPRLYDIWVLLLVATVSTAFVACLYAAILASTNLIAWTDFNVAALRLWIGDLIGIAVATPFALLMAAGRRLKFTWETLAQFVAMCAALWAVFLGPEVPQLYRFYLLFLPIIWIALRSGLPGACAGLLITQLALMFVLGFLLPGRVDITTYQEMMLVLTLTGLAAGGAVMERELVEYRLRLQQESHARLTRLGSVNELSAAVAHEINQPLSAAATYTRLLAEELGEGDFPVSQARESAEKANAQVQRAAAVVRRLRDLIQTGRIEQSPVQMRTLLNAALEVVKPELRRAGVSIVSQIEGDLPPVIVDVLQVEQVLINLVRNAYEAIEGAGHSSGTISIKARRSTRDALEIVVGDTGPGFDSEQIANPFAPFHTTKRGGLGMGLNLCRSIVEAHGGQIWLANGQQGAEVHLTFQDRSSQVT
jgi:two-component system sensor kinase FixL